MIRKIVSKLFPGTRTPYKRYCGAQSPDGKFFCVKRRGHDSYHRSAYLTKFNLKGYYAWGGVIRGDPWFVIATDVGDQGTTAQEE